MRVRLTRALVDKARPGPARVFLWDTEVVGLGLVVHPSGQRTWVFQGNASGGRRVSLAATNLAEARRQAMAVKACLAAPKPPEATDGAPKDVTVGELLDRWVNALKDRPAPPVSLPKIVSCLDTHVRPRVAEKTMTTLARADVLGIRDALVARGKRGMANQTVAYLRAALRWSEDTGLISEAPRWRVSRLRLASRAHALNQDQWRRLLELLHDAGAGLHPIGRLALLALTLTGCRKGEIAGLRWADVTEDGLLLTRHKTSQQTGPKIIEMHDALRRVLLDAKRTATVNRL